jgi:hypothetical protein
MPVRVVMHKQNPWFVRHKKILEDFAYTEDLVLPGGYSKYSTKAESSTERVKIVALVSELLSLAGSVSHVDPTRVRSRPAPGGQVTLCPSRPLARAFGTLAAALRAELDQLIHLPDP